MPYSYAEMRESLFTEHGAEVLTAVRRNVARQLKTSGTVRAQEAFSGAVAENWTMLAALDYMVEMGEIREVTGPDVWGQDRVFVGRGVRGPR